MKPPKCRVCGKEHWNTEPHVMDEAGTQTVVPTKQKFDRTAYQREYMRKRRKKK